MKSYSLTGTSGLLMLLLVLTGAVLITQGERDRPATGETQEARRRLMVDSQLRKRGIRSAAVLAAMAKVPRERFVPAGWRDDAYDDRPLPIGHGQTISQPYIVALMTELIKPTRGMKILEVGTGSGYQAAVLAECGARVYSIEVVPELGRVAGMALDGLGYIDIHLKIGDGYEGWPEEAPFDAILITAAPPERIPQPLLDQLRVGGRLVAPVGRGQQDLVRITRASMGFDRETIAPVRFVPMTGKAQLDF